jgi:hypothetical protein
MLHVPVNFWAVFGFSWPHPLPLGLNRRLTSWTINLGQGCVHHCLDGVSLPLLLVEMDQCCPNSQTEVSRFVLSRRARLRENVDPDFVAARILMNTDHLSCPCWTGNQSIRLGTVLAV